MAFGVILGGVLQLGAQLWALKRLHMLPRIGTSMAAIRQAWQGDGVQRILHLMAPALLGVSVAQLSLLINTQIASHQGAGSVSWLSYADRLMEFPTAMLGVALGVVLMPQLSAAKAANDAGQYSSMLDWGLRLVLVLALPCSLALLVFSEPLVSVLYHYGRFSAQDVMQTTHALMGYGVGLLGLVAIKVLAPGYYASQDIKTPVRIAIVVLVMTQLFNLALVPYLAHAGLALSISLGALLNAGWLLIGLIRRGSFVPLPGWGRFVVQVVVACAVLTLWLYWAAGHWDWVALRSQVWWRMVLLAGIMAVSAGLYFGVLGLTGLKLRSLFRQ
jgi:putative peptidoglycan lipid II flippase